MYTKSMENTKCNSHNGTYTCALAAGHTGTHQVTEYRRNSRNVVIFYITHTWANAYSALHSKKGFC